MLSMPFSLSASMSRWKPSVTCGAASAAVDTTSSTVADAIPFLPLSFCRLTGNVFPAVTNVFAKPHGVFAYQITREIGFALFDRLDDMDMVDDRTLGARCILHPVSPDDFQMREQALGNVLQHIAFRKPKNTEMEIDVSL